MTAGKGGGLVIVNDHQRKLLRIGTPLAAGLTLLLICLAFDFLLFHTLAELFAVAVGLSLFFVSAAVPGGRSRYILAYVGAGYFWVALLDLMHTLTYEGMGVHPLGGADVATQFWLAGRLVETLVLLTTPLLIAAGRRLPGAFGLYAVLASGLYLLIVEGWFPTAYVVGIGLTDFKIYGELALVGLLIVALVLTLRQRGRVERPVLTLYASGIVLTILAELAFTLYVGVFDMANAAGHLLKAASYWCLLAALLYQQPREPDMLSEEIA